MSDQSGETLSNLSHEERRFPPPEDFAAQANVTAEAYDRAIGLSEDSAIRTFLTERRNRLTPQ